MKGYYNAIKKLTAVLCIAALLAGGTVREAKADYKTDREYMQNAALSLQVRGGIARISAYTPGNNKEPYVLALSRNYYVTSEEKRYDVIAIMDSVFSGYSFSMIYVETHSGLTIRERAFYNTSVDHQSSLVTDMDVNFIGGGEDGGVTGIGDYAFANFKVPNGYVHFDKISGRIGAFAFYHAQIAEKFEASGMVDEIGEYAFSGVDTPRLILPAYKKLGREAFSYTDFVTFSLSDKLEIIEKDIFKGCTELETITLPRENHIQEVSEEAFPDKEGLTIEVPAGYEDISAYHFDQYSKLSFRLAPEYTEESNVYKQLAATGAKVEIGEEAEPSASPEASTTPEPTATGTPTAEPTPTITPMEEPTPTSLPTVEPTLTPTVEPTPSSTVTPTVVPTTEPTSTPTVEPTQNPTPTPPVIPTVVPTTEPTPTPTVTATVTPTVTPTAEPTITPTVTPTITSTLPPTETPTPIPSQMPTLPPLASPTAISTAVPTPTSTAPPAGSSKNSFAIGRQITQNGLKYKISGKNTVACTGTTSRKKTIRIPSQIRYQGRIFCVKSIGARAFYKDKKLACVEMGKNVNGIGKSAFEQCSNLKRIIFGKNVTTIAPRAFYKDRKIATMLFKGKKLGKVGNRAFSKGKKKKKVSVLWMSCKEKYARLLGRSIKD